MRSPETRGGLRYGELFAGAGGLSLGLDRAGLTPVFHAEIAEKPRDILAHHWPDVPLYGDVSALDGRELVAAHGPIDLLAGGSPCQDLSVAGKRAGLTEGSGTRSSLFHEQIRLWHETGATYLLWENVAGALSSNGYADFAVVLSAIVGGTVPVPADGWRSAGVVSGPSGVAAWRCLDAQWFGVPQRRLRVFVLGARAGGVDPAEVLLEPQGVRRNPPTRGEAGEGTAASAARRVAGTLTQNGDAHSGFRDAEGIVVSFDWQKGNDVTNVRPSTMSVTEEQSGTLGATRVPAVLSFGWQNSAAQGDDVLSEADASLRVGMTPAVMAFQNTGQGWWNEAPVAQTLRAASGDSSLANVVCATGDLAHSLTAEGHDAGEDGTGRGTPIVADYCADICDTLDTHFGDKMGLENQHINSGAPRFPVQAGIPRRLMPIECERLMDWPDQHTNVPDAKGKPASDAVRYKACGNGVVSSVAEWIGERLVAAECAALTPPQAIHGEAA